MLQLISDHSLIFKLCSYASSFRFAGDHVDKRNLDISGRRKTRIVAIDALCMAGMKQYALKYLLQYVNIGLKHLKYAEN